MKTLKVIIEHAGTNLSAYIKDAPIITVGNSMSDIRKNIEEAISLYLDENQNPLDMFVGKYQIEYEIDASTFINYYSSVFTKAALSRITGINERQLWYYAAGVHKPRKKQIDKIQKGITSLTEELSAICLV